MAIDIKLQEKLKEIRITEETTEFKCKAIINYMLNKDIEITEAIQGTFDELLYDADVRVCDVCKALMKDGYCIEGGDGYRCSDDCLYTNITEEEWEEMNSDGEGDSYWTEWECHRDMYKEINMIAAKYPELGYKVDVGYFPELKKEISKFKNNN